jgi:hypothetical protein
MAMAAAATANCVQRKVNNESEDAFFSSPLEAANYKSNTTFKQF